MRKLITLVALTLATLLSASEAMAYTYIVNTPFYRDAISIKGGAAYSLGEVIVVPTSEDTYDSSNGIPLDPGTGWLVQDGTTFASFEITVHHILDCSSDRFVVLHSSKATNNFGPRVFLTTNDSTSGGKVGGDLANGYAFSEDEAVIVCQVLFTQD